MKSHLAASCLGRVERAAKVDVDGLVEEGWFDAGQIYISQRPYNKRKQRKDSLEKLGKLTNPSIAHENI